MKFMTTRYTCEAYLIAYMFAALSTAKSNNLPPPEPKDIAGIWIGFDEDSLRFYRLELDQDHQGVCSVSFVGQPVTLYAIDKWSMDRFSLALEMSPIQTGVEAISITGEANRTLMSLLVKGTSVKWKRKLLLTREEELLLKNEAAKQAISTYRKKANVKGSNPNKGRRALAKHWRSRTVR
jgi:hypothetical protein